MDDIPHARPAGADAETMARLRQLLSGDFEGSSHWDDLARRLRDKGFVLKAAADRLSLVSWPTGGAVCGVDALGWGADRLTARFGRLN